MTLRHCISSFTGKNAGTFANKVTVTSLFGPLFELHKNTEQPCNPSITGLLVCPGGIEPPAYRLGGGIRSNPTIYFWGKSAYFQAFRGQKYILRLLRFILRLHEVGTKWGHSYIFVMPDLAMVTLAYGYASLRVMLKVFLTSFFVSGVHIYVTRPLFVCIWINLSYSTKVDTVHFTHLLDLT
jgi:hypothetical protein